MNPEIFQQLLLAVMLAIVSIVAYGLRELVQIGIAYLKVKLGGDAYERLLSYVGMAVRWVDQSPIYRDFAGDKKYEMVKNSVLQYAQKHSLPVDAELFDKFIEAAVKEMKSQISPADFIDSVSSELIIPGDN